MTAEDRAASRSAETYGAFDLSGPLPTGVTVLEASAGTGKTFTIAALAARFIAEGAVALEQLLLVTFTRAATSELRERVRDRLVMTERELARIVAGAPPVSDDEVVRLLGAAAPDEVELRRARLAAAIANFDAATIETTHGFCQKVLDSLGTLGDLEPDVTFVESIDDLVKDVVDDLYVWRFAGADGAVRISYREALAIAQVATGNPTAEVYPAGPVPKLDGETAERLAMRARLARRARDELERRKRALALMTYDDQLTRLQATLTRDGRDGGGEAAAMLRSRYRVVLIDEFQDTDPVQWDIVRRAFGTGEVTLILIGDPKQAIYAFRGADVYAYLDAKREASRVATLRVNHRSDQRLLDGLDALFGNARLGHPEIAYLRVLAAPGNRRARLRGSPCPSPLRLRWLDRTDPGVTLTARGHASAPSARERIADDLAADVVRLLDSRAVVESDGRDSGERDSGERDSGGRDSGEPDSGPGDDAERAARTIQPGDVAVLVHTHRQARIVQLALERVGVPVVINGAGSVFATPAAQQWRVLLEALERPDSPPRARAAALTPFLDRSASQLALAEEDQLDELHGHLFAWARILREQGVAALTRTIMLGERMPERLLRLPDGERQLTDLGHVAEVLHVAAGGEQLGVAALTGWLRQRIAAAGQEGANDELTRRLETDADAVQVLTVHRSKGGEFPVVYCPFLWEPGFIAARGTPVYFHDPVNADQRAIDVGLEGPEYRQHYEQHFSEERGEDLRLAYVALTRARHQVVVWWAGASSARDSSLGRLLFARDQEGNIAAARSAAPSDPAVVKRFTEIAEVAGDAVSVERVQLGLPTDWGGDLDWVPELAAATFDRQLDLAWRRTSYTAITAAAHDALVGSEPDQLGLVDEPSGPGEGALASDELPLAAMAMGPRVGTVIHRVLERVELDAGDLAPALTEVLIGETVRAPRLLGTSAESVGAGLALALQTPLGGELDGVALCTLGRRDRLDELEFELPLAGGDVPSATVGLRDVAALLREWLPDHDPLAGYADRLSDPALSTVLRGYLTGLIDLVLRVPDGASGRARFAIVDYKTNWLTGPEEPLSAWHYRAAALATEMQRSHYVLQALLYAVALHRYLRWRVPDYDPETDLAGIHYLFLRGMLGPAGPLIEGSRPGVFSWHPPAGLIVAISEVLDGA